MPSLSVLVPARNEEWLSRTVDDVLAHSSDATDVIVVLDGAWADPPLAQHPRVTVVYLPESIGQRAATNLAARISTADYICKLDAHCSVSAGFDVALMAAAEELGPDVTQIPAQRNLHVFDWVCDACNWRQYQGGKPAACEQCKAPDRLRREVIWQPRKGTTTTSWAFDSVPHFQYWKADQKKQQGEICDVMSSLGACFFMRRDRFWQLGGLDEQHGSWGNLGVEVACKSWLSGGRHIVNKRVSFSHLFRTGKGYGFPYEISGSDQERAREYSRQLWFNNAWPGQKLPLAWLIDKFRPDCWYTVEAGPTLSRVRDAAAAFARVLSRAGTPALNTVLPSVTTDGQQMADLAVGPESAERFFQAEPHSFNTPLMVPSVHAGSAVSHQSLGVSLRSREKMPSGAMSLGAVDGRDGVGAAEILALGHKPQVSGVAARRRVTHDVVDHGDVACIAARQGTNQPREHQAVQCNGVGQAGQVDLPVSVLVSAAVPNPAAAVVDGDISEDAGERLAVEMRNGEILRGSHASASIADVRSGPVACDQHAAGPSIVASAGIVYYSDGRPDPRILRAAQRTIAASGLPIAAVTLAPLDWPGVAQTVLPLARGYVTMFKQILAGLEALDTDVAFLCEHDVCYAPSHFTFRPPTRDCYYYNVNVWKVSAEDGRAVTYETKQTSGLCADRQLLIAHYRERIRRVEADGFSRRMGFEPGSHRRPERVDDVPSATWRSDAPNVDIRHGACLTASRWSPSAFRDPRNCRGWQEADGVPGWGLTRGRFDAWLAGVLGETAAA